MAEKIQLEVDQGTAEVAEALCARIETILGPLADRSESMAEIAGALRAGATAEAVMRVEDAVRELATGQGSLEAKLRVLEVAEKAAATRVDLLRTDGLIREVKVELALAVSARKEELALTESTLKQDFARTEEALRRDQAVVADDLRVKMAEAFGTQFALQTLRIASIEASVAELATRLQAAAEEQRRFRGELEARFDRLEEALRPQQTYLARLSRPWYRRLLGR